MALLSDDAADGAQLLKIAVWFGPAAFIMLTALWFFLAEKEVIPGWVALVMIVLDIPIIVGCIFAIHWGTNRAATGFVNTLHAAGNIPPPPSYPNQDVLIARGRYQDAADWFRDHLTVEPEDNEARLRLADLLEQHLDDPAEAERLYLEVRRRQPDGRQEVRVANGLIDLYRKQGRRDRLMVELARFADRYRGTPGAAAASRLLRELKAGS